MHSFHHSYLPPYLFCLCGTTRTSMPYCIPLNIERNHPSFSAESWGPTEYTFVLLQFIVPLRVIVTMGSKTLNSKFCPPGGALASAEGVSQWRVRKAEGTLQVPDDGQQGIEPLQHRGAKSWARPLQIFHTCVSMTCSCHHRLWFFMPVSVSDSNIRQTTIYRYMTQTWVRDI